MSYKIYDFAELRFTKEYLNSLPDYHLNFLVSSSLAGNDVSIFTKLVLGYGKHGHYHKDLEQILGVHHWTLRRLLSAKLVEFVHLFEGYAKILNRKNAADNSKHAKKINTEIAIIKSSNEFKFALDLRNKLTNHYALRNARDLLNEHKDSTFFSILLATQPGNSYFPLGEDIAHLSHFDQDPTKGLDLNQTQKWMHNLGGVLVKIHSDCISFIIESFPNGNYSKKTCYVDDELISNMEKDLPLLFFSGNNTRY